MPLPLYKTGDNDVKVTEKLVMNKFKWVYLEEYTEYIDVEKLMFYCFKLTFLNNINLHLIYIFGS